MANTEPEKSVSLARIRVAIEDFNFSGYGCDDIDEIIADPDLDLLEALATHIYFYVEDI